MANMLQTAYSNAFVLWDENYCILIQFSLNIITQGLIDNNLALVQVMVCYLIK